MSFGSQRIVRSFPTTSTVFALFFVEMGFMFPDELSMFQDWSSVFKVVSIVIFFSIYSTKVLSNVKKPFNGNWSLETIDLFAY